MSEDLAVREPQSLTAGEMKAQVQLIQQVMSEVMVKEVHYGTIPGCGVKPALLKPGAEKLMMTFRLAADPHVVEVPTEDGITFRVFCRITNQATGIFLGNGIGECSSKEEKYNWRKAVCDGEYNDTPEDRRRGKWAKGYDGKPDYQIKQVRMNPADVANTILKMAKKRALVDAILTVTAASDIFEQDLEEMPEDIRQGNGEPQQKKSSTVKTQSQTQTGGALINEKQVKLVYARMKGKGINEDAMKKAFGVASLKDIPALKVNEILTWIDKGGPAMTDDPAPMCNLSPESCGEAHFTPDQNGELIAQCARGGKVTVCEPGKEMKF